MEGIVRRLTTHDLPCALDLVWRGFLKFEAPDYPAEGLQEFRDYLAPLEMAARLSSGALLFWGCFVGETLGGVLALRPPGHISLLFVEEAYHRQGLARRLLGAAVEEARNQGAREMTVNASPYGHAAYLRLGFSDTGPEETSNGLRFVPMRHIFA